MMTDTSLAAVPPGVRKAEIQSLVSTTACTGFAHFVARQRNLGVYLVHRQLVQTERHRSFVLFRQQPAGKYVIKVCRTLSCALGGSGELHKHFCQRLGLDSHAHGAQTTKDGKYTVEFVECLASCGTAPVMMCNEDFYEGVSQAKADEIMARCK